MNSTEATAAPATESQAQAIDRIATQILTLVEQLDPSASPISSGRYGTEALLAALARRLGPLDYVDFLSSMPLSRSR